MWSRVYGAGIVIVALLAMRLGAHDSLYHYLEISLPRGEEAVEVSCSVHAAELETARALGADPAGVDLSWLQGRTAADLAPLLEEARALISGTFSLRTDGKEVSLEELVRFPEAGVLAIGAEAARPGFLVATLTLPSASAGVEVLHAPSSGKRLMVVVNRPGAFPEVRDLAPGEVTAVSFQKP